MGWLILGLFIGSTAGFLLAAILAAGADKRNEKKDERIYPYAYRKEE